MAHRSRFARDRGEDRNEGSPLAAAVVAVSVGAALMYGLKSLISSPEPALAGPNEEGDASMKRSSGDIGFWQRSTREELRRKSDDPDKPPREGLECKICMHREVEFVLECGHLLCPKCAVNIISDTRQCPFDRREVHQPPKRVFL